MSYIRAELKPDDHLFQSMAVDSPPSPSATTPLPQPARRWSWHAIRAHVRAWRVHRQARRDLSMLDARTLRDLGISRTMVMYEYEMAQSFWRAPRDMRS